MTEVKLKSIAVDAIIGLSLAKAYWNGNGVVTKCPENILFNDSDCIGAYSMVSVAFVVYQVVHGK